MRRFLVLALCALSVLAAAGGRDAASAQTPPATGQGTVVVRYRSGEVAAQTAGAAAPSLEAQGYRTLAVPPGMTRDTFLAQIRADPDVLDATPDADVYATAIPDDPYYFLDQSVYMAQVNAPGAWDLMTGAGSVIVAVLDTGIDVSHPELASRLWQNPGDSATDGIDHDGNGCVNDYYGCRFVEVSSQRAQACGYSSGTPAPSGAISDDHGKPGASSHSHGTLVAGIIGAAGDNNVGVTGVAWNVELMTVKVLDCGPDGQEPTGKMSSVAKGIDYARRMGANIINISLATRAGDTSGDQPDLRQAIQDAAAAGIIIVAAAGNDGGTVGYPAAYTQYANVVAVAASDYAGNRAAFSNYGPAIDFAAPGIQIAGPVRTAIGPGEPYGRTDGTSFSAPLVTGMFALMEARNGRLGATQYIDLAKAAVTAAGTGPPGWAGAGIINMAAAVARVPMLLTGAALQDWKDVPAGTAVTARIDGVLCGTATTTTFLAVSRFELRVKAASEQAGCGAPGKTVQVTVGGLPAQPTFTWGGKNESLALVNREVSSVSPPPGPLVVQALGNGWSQVAFLDADGPLPAALATLSSSWTAVLRWDAALEGIFGTFGAFRHFLPGVPEYVNTLLTLKRYDALWVYGPPATIATANPSPVLGRTVLLAAGWNAFTWTGTNSEVTDALKSIAGHYSAVALFDNASAEWQLWNAGQPRYLQDFGGLFRYRVYWIYVDSTVSLVMN